MEQQTYKGNNSDYLPANVRCFIPVEGLPGGVTYLYEEYKREVGNALGRDQETQV